MAATNPNIPQVVIVGRPNVGKSTLFNRLVGKRKAIVSEEPGITRDRLISRLQFQDCVLELMDTGGMDINTTDRISQAIIIQVKQAINRADLILFVVDAISGLNPLDEAIADILRRSNKNIILAVNKIDNEKLSLMVHEFSRLGFKNIQGFSATHDRGIGDLIDEMLRNLPRVPLPLAEATALKIAVIGRPNAGKSSFINYLLNESRLIVDPVPGTTRDAVDIQLNYNGRDYIFIDTAGMRQRRKLNLAIEIFSLQRAKAAVEEADACILVVDAAVGITVDDRHIIEHVMRKTKPAVMVLNKWDLQKNKSASAFIKELKTDLSFFYYAPVLATSAVTGHNVFKSVELVSSLCEKSRMRFATSALNALLKELQNNAGLQQKRRYLNLKFITQVNTAPLVFAVFVNNLKLATDDLRAYFERMLRKRLQLDGVPMKLVFRNTT